MPSIKRFNLAIQTPDGEMPPAQIDVSDEPMRLSEIVPLLHDLASKAVELALKRAQREGKVISCKAGCGVCCCQLVPIAPAEVFYMVEKLMSMPLEKPSSMALSPNVGRSQQALQPCSGPSTRHGPHASALRLF